MVPCFFGRGGHGALLANLREVAQNASFILIRNIDNVVPEPSMALRNSEESHLLGVCVQLTEQRDVLLREVDLQNKGWKAAALEWLLAFDRSADATWSGAKLREAIDRPIRVGGMVLNEGAPGGGPFWVRYSNGAGISGYCRKCGNYQLEPWAKGRILTPLISYAVCVVTTVLFMM